MNESTTNGQAAAAHTAKRIGRLRPSPIREILSVIDRPGMISFAGGLPAPDSFPRLNPGQIPAERLQYGPSEGEPELRRQVARDLGTMGLAVDPDQVLVLSGSQQGIDLIAKLFIETGTPVAVESPTYLAARQVFRLFGASLVPLELDGTGVLPRRGPSPILCYAVPTFQNPTGRCLSNAQRNTLARYCDDHDIVLFEDDPYRDLAYDPCERTPVCSRLRRARWIYQTSCSKTLCPGLRLGYLAASKDLMEPLLWLKQAADLHSSRISQWLVLQQCQQGAERMDRLVAGYRARRDAFAAELATRFGDLATWELPSGGLFFWLELKRRIDTRELLPQALGNHVAFMPGEPFYPDDRPARGRLRLNFSHASPSQARAGLSVLADLVRAADMELQRELQHPQARERCLATTESSKAADIRAICRRALWICASAQVGRPGSSFPTWPSTPPRYPPGPPQTPRSCRCSPSSASEAGCGH